LSIVDATFRTLTCNICEKTVTFLHPSGLQEAIEANLWIKTTRIIQTGDGRNFSYCSDLCEIAGIETTLHNVQEAPKVAIPTGSAQAQIAAAAAAAKLAENATKAMKDGSPITLK
jgi:hypothetical protein